MEENRSKVVPFNEMGKTKVKQAPDKKVVAKLVKKPKEKVASNGKSHKEETKGKKNSEVVAEVSPKKKRVIKEKSFDQYGIEIKRPKGRPKMSKSQKASAAIRRANPGVEISDPQMRLMKKHLIMKGTVVNGSQKVFYFKTKRANSNDQVEMMILFALVIKIIKAKLNMPRKQNDFLVRSVAIAEAITLNTGSYFSPAFAGLALLISRNTALDQAIKNVQLGVIGAVAAKRSALADVWKSLKLALAYINGLAALRQDIADDIITSALMYVIVSGSINKAAFALVKKGAGTLQLVSLAAKIDGKYVKATYESQVSTTPAEPRVWAPLSSGGDSKETVDGFASGIRVWIRRRTKTKKGGIGVWVVCDEVPE